MLDDLSSSLRHQQDVNGSAVRQKLASTSGKTPSKSNKSSSAGNGAPRGNKASAKKGVANTHLTQDTKLNIEQDIANHQLAYTNYSTTASNSTNNNNLQQVNNPVNQFMYSFVTFEGNKLILTRKSSAYRFTAIKKVLERR